MARELFNVRSVAVIGASENPKKLGYTIVKNLVHYRFRGAIYPILASFIGGTLVDKGLKLLDKRKVLLASADDVCAVDIKILLK